MNTSSPIELINQPLYDFKEIIGGGSYEFFGAPIGTDSADLYRNGFERTNMYCSHMLPRANCFVIKGIRVIFFPNVDSCDHDRKKDARKIYSNGCLTLLICNKYFLNLGPLGIFPPLIDVYQDIAENRRALSRHGYFSLEHDLNIGPTQYFSVSIFLDTRIKLSSAGRLGVVLDGTMYRESF